MTPRQIIDALEAANVDPGTYGLCLCCATADQLAELVALAGK